MNRVLYAADCLDVLNDAGKLPTGSVDLIYLDPPFNSNSSYNLPFKSRDRSLKPVEAFEDTWRWRADDDERLSELEKTPRRAHWRPSSSSRRGWKADAAKSAWPPTC